MINKISRITGWLWVAFIFLSVSITFGGALVIFSSYITLCISFVVAMFVFIFNKDLSGFRKTTPILNLLCGFILWCSFAFSPILAFFGIRDNYVVASVVTSASVVFTFYLFYRLIRELK